MMSSDVNTIQFTDALLVNVESKAAHRGHHEVVDSLIPVVGRSHRFYSTIDLVRDSNGAIYVDETNAVSTSAIQDKEDYIKLGTVLPKGNLAWNNSFSWKNFGASC